MADLLSGIPTNGKDKTLSDGNVSVLVLTCEFFAQEWKSLELDEDENLNNEKTAQALVPLLPEAVSPADDIQSSWTDIASLVEFIKHQARDNRRNQAALTVGKPNTVSSSNADGLLVRLSPIGSVS